MVNFERSDIVTEKQIDNITKFFELFRSLTPEQQQKALLVIQGMALVKATPEKELVKPE